MTARQSAGPPPHVLSHRYGRLPDDLQVVRGDEVRVGDVVVALPRVGWWDSGPTWIDGKPVLESLGFSIRVCEVERRLRPGAPVSRTSVILHDADRPPTHHVRLDDPVGVLPRTD